MINIVDWSLVRKFVRLASSRGNNASLVLVLAASGALFPSTPFPQDQPLGVPLRGPPTTLHESRHRGEAAAKKKRGRVSHQGPTTTTGPSSTSPLPGRPPREHDYAEIKLGSLLCRAEIRSLRVEGARVSVELLRTTDSGDFQPRICQIWTVQNDTKVKMISLYLGSRAIIRGSFCIIELISLTTFLPFTVLINSPIWQACLLMEQVKF